MMAEQGEEGEMKEVIKKKKIWLEFKLVQKREKEKI